jgi:hypothetical protein
MCTVGVILICDLSSFSQSSLNPQQNGVRRPFDVASVKISKEPILQTRPNRQGGRVVWSTDGVSATTARRITMLQCCGELERVLGGYSRVRPHQSAGNYYFAIRYTTEPGDFPVPVLFTVVQEELGLRLTRQRGPVDTLVVDHIERVPTPN